VCWSRRTIRSFARHDPRAGARPGIEVIGEADNGITAMELARQLKPDVMVLDLRMPGVGGAVVLERLRAELPEIRALVMAANESPESLLDAVAARAAGYLSKRTTGEELRQAVITTYGGGSVITPELAGHLLREFSGSARGEGSSVRPLLAARELEILRLVADGLTDNEIGKQLYISPRTVQTTSPASARRPACAGAPSSPAGPSNTRSPSAGAIHHPRRNRRRRRSHGAAAALAERHRRRQEGRAARGDGALDRYRTADRAPDDLRGARAERGPPSQHPGTRRGPREAPRSPSPPGIGGLGLPDPTSPRRTLGCPGAQTKGSSMTRLSCPSCQLRFSAAAAASITTCPDCGRQLEAVISAEDTLGFRLFTPLDPQPELPMAVEAALPIHDLRPDFT
jgi:DNA-binding NarL/FixJ family response regulator